MNNIAKRLIPLIDLTRLVENDKDEPIRELCHAAQTTLGPVAAVCIYPNFVRLAKKCLQNTTIKIATVVNFPSGNELLEDCLKEIETALQDGANEIDVVLPYQNYLDNNVDDVREFLQACRGICEKNIILKVILETGALINANVIADAANLAIICGADFIKTSTGKITAGATLDAAATILDVIKKYPQKTVGLKLSGGIQTMAQAAEYIDLVEKKMGPQWISPRTLRFGASRLLQDILHA
jgi:deoxyribose-phosphate aldolase